MTRCRICDKEYVPYQSTLGDKESLCQECEESVLETIAEWELDRDVPESQCAAHTEAVGGSQDSPILSQTSSTDGANYNKCQERPDHPEREMCPVCGLKWFPHEWPNDCITKECPNGKAK